MMMEKMRRLTRPKDDVISFLCVRKKGLRPSHGVFIHTPGFLPLPQHIHAQRGKKEAATVRKTEPFHPSFANSRLIGD